MAEKSYRIRTNLKQDNVVKASLTQDIDFFEVLSLKINQLDTYKLHASNYGIIVGRILANEAFGIPNARVSVFVELSNEDIERTDIVNLYPYKTVYTKDKENRRYNLLPNENDNDCYSIVGTFPNKRLVLDNDTEIEIFEKYWKYTTVTNQSGDYMIFGVPTGQQTIHVDVDLSDIGILSQKPRDFYYKGYNKEQFESAEQFKTSTNLDSLSQILSQTISIHVYPFFGAEDNEEIAITRCDIDIPYKFEPTCVFMGSIISDKPGQHIGHACGPSRWIGYNRNMVTGEGTIEMIRKTPDGLVEEFPIKGNHLIDGDGVWCYQIPMNLDYIGTDEFGNIIPVQDSTKGIPTRTSVRFRVSMRETKTQTSTEHVAKYLVPNIHELNANSNQPQILKGASYNKCYEFGSATPNEFFRDLLWNKVYSVKNYIPRIQTSSSSDVRSYSGVRSVSSPHNNNVFPFNSAYFRLTFTYRLLCLVMHLIVTIIGAYNKLVSEVICWKLSFKVFRWKVNLGRPLSFLSKWIKCIGMKGSWFFEERADTYYFPRCDKDCGSIIENDGLIIVKDKDVLMDVIQQTLAMEYEIVNLDFHNDWINGTLYLPLWFWKKRAKKKYFFGLFSKRAVNTFCSCDKQYSNLYVKQGCKTMFDESFSPLDVGDDSEKYRHRWYDSRKVSYGVIKEFTNKDNLNVYYYAPGMPIDYDYETNESFANYTRLFATDIILLGSLNQCDLDNLPRTFDSLPSSTVNLPFIATLNNDETGDGVVTGLDWEHDGSEQSVKYGKGLLMDIECWNVYTRFKSCVNLSRLSELHVTLDMDITSDDKSYPNVQYDGLITSKELVENETRAKFASLNHNGLTNLTKNITTNYDTYKFHYIYPTNFDGHLSKLAPFFTQTRKIVTQDVSDYNYVMYRLGEGKDSAFGRHKKHFYNGSENEFSFPLYNNSFYFYFGLNEGKTAIDKFNTLYNASCHTQNKFPFTIEYNAKPGKWCYNSENVATDFGTIDIEFNGLTDIFSYSLYNEFNELLISEKDVKSESLRFGYAITKNGGDYIRTSGGFKKDGRLCSLKTGEFVKNIFDEPILLENGVYYLEVINSLGMKVTQRINMLQNTVTPNFDVIGIGTRFLKNQSANDICGEMDYYGELRINSFIIDGENSFIQSITPFYIDGKLDGEQPKEVTCRVECTDGSSLYVILEPENDETQDISNFVCYGVGDIPSVRLEMIGENIYSLIYNIWKPGNYSLTVNQICNGVMNDNMSVNTFSIENGETFQVFMNGIPISLLEKSDMLQLNENYKEKISSNDTFPRGWLQLHNPKVYNFNGTLYENIDEWEKILNVTSSSIIDNDENIQIIEANSKINILNKELNTIANIINSSYIMGDEESPQLVLTTKGGKEPILIRNIHPDYAAFDDNDVCENIIIENSNTLEAHTYHAHIIGNSHSKGISSNISKTIQLNVDEYGNFSQNLGNYFAAFTNNGSMVNMGSGCKYDPSLYSQASPENAEKLKSYCPNISVITNNYPSQILSNYFRHLFVEKRITINGDLIIPIYSKYTIGENDNWKKGSWALTINNTVPLLYDEEYNIIGDNLTYQIKEKTDTIIELSSNVNNEYATYKFENDIYSLTINEKMFHKNWEKISNWYQEKYVIENVNKQNFINEILLLCDDIIHEVTISDDNKTLSMKIWKNIDNIEVLNRNTNIGITTNLYWENDKVSQNLVNSRKKYAYYNAKLFDSSLMIDGEEIDMTSKLRHTLYGSETDINRNGFENLSKTSNLIPLYIGGTILELNLSNCKMIGELDYDIVKDENNNENYEFKSYIEKAGEISHAIDVGPRVQLIDGEVAYTSKNTSQYIIYQNQKVNLNTYLQSTKATAWSADTNTQTITAIFSGKEFTNTINEFGNYSYGKLKEKNNEENEISITYRVKRLCVKWEGNLWEIIKNCTFTQIDNFRRSHNPQDLGFKAEDVVHIAEVETFASYQFMTIFGAIEYGVLLNIQRTNIRGGEEYYNVYGVNNKNNGGIAYFVYKAQKDLNSDIFLNFQDGNFAGDEQIIVKCDELSLNETVTKNIDLPTYAIVELNDNLDITKLSYNEVINSYSSNDATLHYGCQINGNFVYLSNIVLDDSENVINQYDNGKTLSELNINIKVDNNNTSFNTSTLHYNPLIKRWFILYENTYFKLNYLFNVIDIIDDKKNEMWIYEGDLNDINKLFSNVYKLAYNEEQDIIQAITEMTIDNSNDVDNKKLEEYNKYPKIKINNTDYYEMYIKNNRKGHISGNTYFLEGIEYEIYDKNYSHFVSDDVKQFICKVENDKFCETFNYITANSPFLFVGLQSNYGLEKISHRFNNLDSNTLQTSYFEISDEDTEIKEKVVVGSLTSDGHFCYNSEYVIYDNLLWDLKRSITKHDSDNLIINNNGEKIEIEVKGEKVNFYWWQIAGLTKRNVNSPSNIKKDDILYWEGKINNVMITINDISQEHAEKVLKQIKWEQISQNKFNELYSYEGECNACPLADSNLINGNIGKDLYYRSLFKESVCDVNKINIKKLGDKIYYIGKQVERNIMEENNTSYNRRLTNTNLPSLLKPSLFGDINEYFTESPLLGEIYPYLNKVFDADMEIVRGSLDEFKNPQYIPLPFAHPVKENKVFNINTENQRIDIKTIPPTYTEYSGTLVYRPLIAYYPDDLSFNMLIESSEESDYAVHILQNNEYKRKLQNGSKILTCGLRKIYYDTNDDYNQQIIPTLNQSTQWHIGDMLFGVGWMDKENGNYYLPIYNNKFIGNVDIINNLDSALLSSNITENVTLEKNTTIDAGSIVVNFGDDVGKCMPDNETEDLFNSAPYLGNDDGSKLRLINHSKIKNWIFHQYSNIGTYLKFKLRLPKDSNITQSTSYTFTLFHFDDRVNNTLNPVESISIDNEEINPTAKKKNVMTKTLLNDGTYGLVFDNSAGNTSGFNVKVTYDKDTLLSNTIFSKISLNNKNSINLKEFLTTNPKETNSPWSYIFKCVDGGGENENVFQTSNFTVKMLKDEQINKIEDMLSNETTTIEQFVSLTKQFTGKNKETFDGKNSDVVVTLSMDTEEIINMFNLNIVDNRYSGSTNYYIASCYESISNTQDFEYEILYDETNLIKEIEHNLNSITGTCKMNLLSGLYIQKKGDEYHLLSGKITNDDYKMFLSDLTNGKEVILCDMRTWTSKIRLLPFKILEGFTIEHDNGIKNKYLQSLYNVRGIGDDYKWFMHKSFTYGYKSENIFETISSADNDFAPNDIILLPYAWGTKSENRFYQIICSDGYEDFYYETENIELIDENGIVSKLSISEIVNGGAIGMYLPHFENINGACLNIVSKISKCELIEMNHIIKINMENWYDGQIIIIYITVNNMKYSFPFKYKNKKLLGFFNYDNE